MNKVSKDQAEKEVREYLEYHDVELDTAGMGEKDIKAIESNIATIVKAVVKGYASIDGGKINYCFKKETNGLTNVVFQEPDAETFTVFMGETTNVGNAIVKAAAQMLRQDAALLMRVSTRDTKFMMALTSLLLV